jgi:hypothetical protein
MNRIAIALSLPVGAALLLHANPSHALTTIIVGGTPYQIDYFTGPLSDLLADPIAPPSSSFPWFGLPALASDFANALFDEGSAPTQTIQDASTLSGDVSVQPLFLTSSTTFAAYDLVASASGPFFCDTGIKVDCEQGSIIWAYVPAAAPVPAPIPLLGAAAAFSFSRKLRRRVNAQKFTF